MWPAPAKAFQSAAAVIDCSHTTAPRAHQPQPCKPRLHLLNQFVGVSRYEEAFNQVLHTGDVDLVDWLCALVDPGELCSREPVPLTQGVLLSLVSQLSTSLLKVSS